MTQQSSETALEQVPSIQQVKTSRTKSSVRQEGNLSALLLSPEICLADPCLAPAFWSSIYSWRVTAASLQSLDQRHERGATALGKRKATE